MNTEIVYDSKTGTTAAASEAMRKAFEGRGHQCRVQSVTQANPVDISQADLVCIGTWGKGLFVIMQHPTDGTMQFIEQLDNLQGKKVIVFCTYKLAAGSTLRKMAEAVERKGATVVGQFKFRGSEPDGEFSTFVKALS